MGFLIIVVSNQPDISRGNISTEELEKITKTFETNLEVQSNETKTYLLEELNKINQVNLDFLSTEFFKNKEELQKFLYEGFKKTRE